MTTNIFVAVHLGNALMQHTPVSILNEDECRIRLDGSNIGYKNSDTCGTSQQNACEVDNGSALACANRSGRYNLKGVYSTETSCTESNQVIAFTKIDLQWIRSFLSSSTRTY
jgi:hypothetical protein